MSYRGAKSFPVFVFGKKRVVTISWSRSSNISPGKIPSRREISIFFLLPKSPRKKKKMGSFHAFSVCSYSRHSQSFCRRPVSDVLRLSPSEYFFFLRRYMCTERRGIRAEECKI
ncbi:hypothetical protein CEXT_714431 [Caerostris extrusa]|uniref:Uncharacterized protein n=1 Tax=Caerostris extrusa TaxID=172846 RepID=A0AAV4M3N1_CAEEX|nr:hypothetical protein CEXT_714431 [Caerostris extrusa]